MKADSLKKWVSLSLYVLLCVVCCFLIMNNSYYQVEKSNPQYLLYFQLYAIALMIGFFGFLASNKCLSFVKKIIIVVVVTVIANIVIIDLLLNINTNVETVSFKDDGQILELQPGENNTFAFINEQCTFDILKVFLEGENSNGVYLSMREADSGKVVLEKESDDNSSISDSSNGKTEILLRSSSSIKLGKYSVYIENRGENPIKLCTVDDHLNVVLIKFTRIGYYIALLLISVLYAYAVLLCFIIRKDGLIKIESFFLITVLTLGFCYYILFTPWSIPDSGAHYLASYRLSNIILGFPKEQYWYGRIEDGRFYDILWGKDNFPGMRGYTDLAYNFALFCKEKAVEDFPYHLEKMEYYSMLCYWPQMLGLTIGRIAGFSAIVCAYMARLMILIFYVLGCMNAVKTTPIGKSVFAMISLLPMSLMNSSAISYDPLCLITTLNFAAGIFALYKNPTSKKMLFQVMVWSFMIGATKGGGYLILLPLAVVIIDRTNIKNSLIKCLCIIGSGLFSVFLFDKWLTRGQEFFQFGGEWEGTMTAGYALEHPVRYIQMCAITYLEKANALFFEMIGSSLAWREDTIPCYIISGLFVIVLLYAVLDEDEAVLDKKCKYSFAVIVALSILTTPAMLLSWTREGSLTIGGLQGRYYLPVLVTAVLFITKFSLYRGNTGNTEIVRRTLSKNKLLCMFAMLSCLSVYYMMRLYLRR